MLKGFRDFILRGNVVDLAVGIVIGAAFGTLVTQFTDSFLTPLVKLVSGGEGITAGTFTVRGIEFDWSAFVNAVLSFVLVAAALYFLVVLPMNKLAELRRRGQATLPATQSEEIRLLTEIRDALVAARVPAQRHAAPDDAVGGQ